MPTDRQAPSGNGFQRYGVDLSEYAAALAEALREGGATDDEIREATLGAHVDQAMPDDGPWSVVRREP